MSVRKLDAKLGDDGSGVGKQARIKFDWLYRISGPGTLINTLSSFKYLRTSYQLSIDRALEIVTIYCMVKNYEEMMVKDNELMERRKKLMEWHKKLMESVVLFLVSTKNEIYKYLRPSLLNQLYVEQHKYRLVIILLEYRMTFGLKQKNKSWYLKRITTFYTVWIFKNVLVFEII